MGLVFVEEDGQVVLTGCGAVQLRNQQCSSVVDHVINSGVQEYHKRYRSGTRTVMTLTQYWLEEFRKLHTACGVPKSAIVMHFKLGMDKIFANLGPKE